MFILFLKRGGNFAHAETECRSKNKHAKKRVNLGVGRHSTKKFISRHIWSSKIDSKTILQEFSVDKPTLSEWFNKGNAFANIRNGRSYAQVTAQKKLLPVSAACVHQTPDRNANAKKVHNFLQILKVPASKNIPSAQLGSITPRVVSPDCAEERTIHAYQKSLPIKQSNIQSLTLTNRFQALPVEEINLKNVGDHTFDTRLPQNDSNGLKLKAHVNNTPVNRSTSHKNVLSTSTPVVMSQPSNPEPTHVKLTKGDQIQPSVTNVMHDTSAEHIQHGQLDLDMAATQVKNVPEDVWQNRFSSKDYNACIHQNGDNFGYIPLNDLHIYKRPVIQWKSPPDIWQANKLIRESKVPNFLNCRIPVKTQLNPDKRRLYLAHYWDQHTVWFSS